MKPGTIVRASWTREDDEIGDGVHRWDAIVAALPHVAAGAAIIGAGFLYEDAHGRTFVAAESEER